MLDGPVVPDPRTQPVVGPLVERNAKKHLLPPEYHGDPLDPRGCLCYHHFGWVVIDFLKAAGFRQTTAYSIWSRELGYLAGEGDIVQFIAVK